MSSDDVPPGARCFEDGCQREAVNPDHPAGFCPEHHPDRDGRSWDDADFTDPASGQWAPLQTEFDQWMCREESKAPFAPWTDADAPVECRHADHDGPTTCDECDHHAGYKWGSTGSAEYVHSDHETAREWAAKDPTLSDDLVFIQRERDPFAFVDGDDVRCPETGEVHPAFRALLEHLGVTYADISTSGTGVHAVYQGELPIEGKGQADFELDTEPWGANDDVPTVEFYANKHVCIATGKHVPGSGTDVTQWDADALRAILQANGYDDEEEVTHDTDRELDLEDHDPDATTADETTTDVRDILAAVDDLAPRDLPLRARQVGTDATGWEQWDPSTYRQSSGNDSLHTPDRETFHDHKKGEAFGVLKLFALERGIISKPSDRLAGREWWAAVEAARDAGAPIPEYEGPRAAGDDVEHTAVFPPAVRDLTPATSGWDWRHSGQAADTLTVDEGRERTVEAVADAYDSYDHVLVEALPTMGKSYGAVKAAAETGEPVTILTGRGRKEQYAQFKEWAKEHDLDVYELPAFTHDCDTANGEHGQEWAETVRDWYHRGATPKEIHKSAEYVLGEPLPCQRHEGHDCPYKSKWNFDPDDYDILLGHYSHAHKSKVTAGRSVVFDEFPDAYEKDLVVMQGAISYWLSTVDGVPFENYADLRDNRDDEQRRADALLWFDEHGVEPDEGHVFDDSKAHADAPLAVFTLLAGEDLGNGFEQADLDESGVGVYNRESDAVSVLRPPPLTDAPPSRKPSGIVALDGTPTKRMWELALGERLTHRPVLQDGERAEYIDDALNLNFVRTTEYIKSYNSSDHVSAAKDAALLEAIADEHDQRPSLITTATAEEEYDAAGVLDLVDETKHYGNVLGSNEFDETRLGAVVGSNHYGDHYIQKWGAYAGEAVERGEGKGTDLEYSGFGDDVLTHMREHDTLQAAMRFGRDGNGAVVYVHTDTLPDWVPVAGEARVVRTHDDGERQVLDVIEGRESWTTTEIANADDVDVSERRVRQILDGLAEQGALEKGVSEADARAVEWSDAGVDDLADHVELPDIDDPEGEGNDDRSCGNSRIEHNYTWVSATSPPDRLAEWRERGESPTPADERVADGGVSGGPPPG